MFEHLFVMPRPVGPCILGGRAGISAGDGYKLRRTDAHMVWRVFIEGRRVQRLLLAFGFAFAKIGKALGRQIEIFLRNNAISIAVECGIESAPASCVRLLRQTLRA